MKQYLLKIKFLCTNTILKSSAGVLLITLFVKLFGYAEKLILAKYFGTSDQVDVYLLVLTIVLSIFYFFREVIEPGVLNVFLKCIGNNKETEAWVIFNKVFQLILGLTIALSFIAILFPQLFTSVFAPGFEGEKLLLVNQLVPIVIPAGIFLSLSTLTSITLNGLKLFVLPASGELAFKGAIVICMILFYKEYGIVGASIGIVLGSIGKLVVHITKLYKKVTFRRVKINAKYKKQIWQLTWPLLVGVSFSQLSGLVDNIFASYLQEGAIAALSYAKKVVELPVILFPYVISIVIFPFFTQLSVEKQTFKLNKLLLDSLKWIVIAFIPISIFFVIYSRPIIEIVFQRGAFDVNSTLLTADPFLIYSTGLVFFAIETILVVFYYSKADTITPVFVGIVCVIINILLTWIFIQYMEYLGIAIAFVVQKCIKNIVLLFLLKRKITIANQGLWRKLFKIIIGSTIFAFFVVISKLLYMNLEISLLLKLSTMGLFFIISGLIYIVVLVYLNVIDFRIVGQNE